MRLYELHSNGCPVLVDLHSVALVSRSDRPQDDGRKLRTNLILRGVASGIPDFGNSSGVAVVDESYSDIGQLIGVDLPPS